MNIKNFHNYKLLKVVQQLNLWAFILGIPVLVFYATPIEILLCVISILCISKVGNSIGQHRYFTHRSFKTGKFREIFITLMATLSTTASVIHYVSVHRYHHLTSDTEKDPHSPKRLGFFRTFFLFMTQESIDRIPQRLVKDLLRNEFVVFCHNWYWPIILTYILILAIINPILILYCYMIPAGYSKFISGIQLTLSHMYGYRNFETSDDSTNSRFLDIITLGEGLHNNHHARPGEYSFDFTKKPGEFDITGFMIRTLFLKA